MASEEDSRSMAGGEPKVSGAPVPAPAKGRILHLQMCRLVGKIALITGGASGLGKATAREFIQQGAAVVIADVYSKLGLQTAGELGPQAHFVHCDVTVEESVAGAVGVTRSGRLDVMLNSAGVAGSLAGTSRMAELDLAQLDAVMAANSWAYLDYPLGPPLPMVVEQFSTMLGGAADEEQVAAIIRGLGELKGATCEVVDVARVAVYLASDDAKYVSGHNLVVDGGFTSYKHLNLPFPTKPQE
ncbi:unnamed protein product [Miscanthus lutarioriparius]|uniref:Uncharacterized protein n=1 Tax=Miscanthus lutarioriparius TaxID=422564 RepID=A0A811Q969_9POAL|nr:unnamed protein product [Miscanthus lutarioriparius]